MQRKIIRIDDEKCNGCGQCIPGCPEGALQIVSGKARLIREPLCDGLGACIGHCPEGAITIEERQADAYVEREVIARMARQGKAAVESHLEHLREHNEVQYLREAMNYLQEIGFDEEPHQSGCAGSRTVVFEPAPSRRDQGPVEVSSQLTHWPIQLHLIQPLAPHYQGSDLVLAADCVAYSMGDFHGKCLRGRTLAIACPKLDQGQDIYLAKLTSLVQQAEISRLTVMIMQVPCCRGLLGLASQAVEKSGRRIPLRCVVVGLKGDVLQETESTPSLA